jgi:DNA-binding beta-propeller fold protein YncE
MERFWTFTKIKTLSVKTILLAVLLLAAFNTSQVCIGDSILSLRVMDGSNAEILQYCNTENLIITTNDFQKRIDFYRVNSFYPLDLQKLKTFVNTYAEPTSVALSPNLPVVFATVKDGVAPKDVEGQMLVIDIRKGTLGDILSKQKVGVCPDSLAASPDGNWVIVANEAEENTEIAGSITVFDLREVNGIEDIKKTLKHYNLNGLDKLLAVPAGEIEPEFVCFAPDSSFVAVGCQENSAIVFIDLRESEPFLAGFIQLPVGSNPDGIAILGGIKIPGGADSFLLGIAEEGDSSSIKRQAGQSVSFYSIDPSNLKSGYKLLLRIKAYELFGGSASDRYDPEGITMFRDNDKFYAAIAIERADAVTVLDITDPVNPKKVGIFAVGKRPEGIITVSEGGNRYILTANEGKNTAQLSIINFRE